MSTDSPHRGNDTLVSGSSAWFDAYGVQNRPVINAAETGGQYGWAPNIYQYVSEHPHIQQQTWAFMLSSPSFFSKLPAGTLLNSLAKSWFETRSRQIDGLSHRIELEFAEQRFAGRVFSVPSGGQRTLGTLSVQGVDVEGEVYTKMHNTWVVWGGYDPDIGAPRLVTLDDPGDMLIDQLSASLILFEPTRNMRDIAHACLAVGVMPRNTVEIQMRKNRDEAGQMRDINMEYTALMDFDTEAAIEIARTFLSRMPMYNPSGRAAEAGFTSPTATLSALTETGILEQMTKEAAKVTNPNYLA